MLHLERVGITQQGFSLAADLSVARGRRVAVLGPSGAGKSTLLAAIAGFLPLSAGRILWDGDELSTLPPGARPVSILFQDNNLFPHLTAEQNVALGLRPSLRLTEGETTRVQAALVRVGLAGLGNRRPAELSGGQQGRVALARALLRSRPILLLDEPFAALGPALKAEMLELVHSITTDSGATLLMVTHDPRDAETISEEVILVANGRADPPRPTAEILANPPEALRQYLGQ